MYKIGQKVQLTGTTEPIIGYIVKMEIDPLDELDVAFESKHWVTYTVRMYRPFLKNGYFDFQRCEGDLKNADD